jgi:O-antigen/teichoic acid export membrane protein
MATENRHLVLSRLIVMEIAGQVIQLSVNIIAAYFLRSVWALLLGWVVADVVRLIFSFTLLKGIPNKFEWDKEAARDLVHVGRWVILSTAATFGAGYVDRLTLGRLLSVTELGIYNIAYFLASAGASVIRSIGSRVLFPALSETLRDDPHLLRKRLHKIRVLWVLPTVAVLLVLIVGGPWIVRLLYRRDYWEAGWMLRLLAAGSIPMVLNQSYGIVWPALAEWRTNTFLMMIQVPLLLALSLVGHRLHGLVGFVSGVALVELAMYPVTVILIARRKLWQPALDLPVLALGVALVLFFHGFTGGAPR